MSIYLLCSFMIYNYCVTGVRIKQCLGKDGVLKPYNDFNEGCCKGIYNKTVGADNFACCEGNYEVYNILTHVCRGNQLRRINDEKQSYECCENELRDKRIGVCCENVYYENGRKGECCGQLLNKRNQYMCCKDKSSNFTKLYHKTLHQKCCGINSYNRKTHYCKKDQPIPIGFGECNGKIFKINKELCCKNRIHIKTDKKENDCCEDVPYSTTTSECSHGHGVPKGHAWCSVFVSFLLFFSTLELFSLCL